ncbi:ArsR family transcriptional regulator [Methanogenium marinum]|uniref:ArsR family transcriptional regulator n=1 Tax=Methanogenium marinum TaxID=348610 RepID=A0A9Q4KS66_9EURY|nr:ArsR family transcriptional regulator [Methanogenium marinum]MDE4907757.1 ArsR family transcriptional regulator [Methanogenium marinum]
MARPFEGVFGNTCEMRLLEFLLPLEGIEFNVTELSEEAGVSRVTTGKVVRKFVEWGILNASNTRISQYSINPDSPIVQSIDSMNNSLIERMLGEEKIQEIRTYVHQHTARNVPVTPESSTEDVWARFSNGQDQGLSNPEFSQGYCCENNGADSWLSVPPCATASESETNFNRIYQ